MTLIKSISGIRGTIGGSSGEGLTPLDVVKFTSAFTSFIKEKEGKDRIKVVIGRDARISGDMVRKLVVGTLQGMGADVVDLDLSTTPTVELAVPAENADAGIILTASHNPKQWNALKLLNSKGEFINAEEGAKVLQIAEDESFLFADVDDLGTYERNDSYLDFHVNAVLDYPLVNKELIAKANFTVAIDCVNSTGGIFLPALLKALGVQNIIELYTDPTGHFPHNPEPLPEHLTDISQMIQDQGAHVGFVVDPDVDRLAMVCEDGTMFGEEYTLVAIADYFMKHNPGNTVSNLSSTRALNDVTVRAGAKYTASAVGEVNVVNAMKEKNAVIGGEGNGGIIVPDFHYGRDALIGIGLFLTHLAESGMRTSEMRDSYPRYSMSKNKIQLTPDLDVDGILKQMELKYAGERLTTVDGVKIDFENEWVHLRKSNTEPIIRIYTEAGSPELANQLAERFMNEIREISSNLV